MSEPAHKLRRMLCSSGRLWRTNFAAPFLDFGFDRVANLTRAGEFFRLTAWQGGRIGKTPMHPPSGPRKNGASLRARFIANGDDVVKGLAGIQHFRHPLGPVPGDVYAELPHGFDDDGVEFAGLETGALGFEL